MESRVRWAIHGERNTKYYHALTLSRRTKNRIFSPKNLENSWEFEQQVIRKIFQNSFVSLFTTSRESGNINNQIYSAWHWGLFDEEKGILARSIDNREIFSALSRIESLKASGKDVYHAFFYKKCWHIVGNLVLHFIRNIFSSYLVLEKLRQTYLILILKKSRTEISLCNTLYKIISKVSQ